MLLAGGTSEPSQGFWVYLEPPRDHPGGYGSVSRGMGGKEKKRGFYDFGMNAVVHREISKEESVKSFVSKCSKCSQ